MPKLWAPVDDIANHQVARTVHRSEESKCPHLIACRRGCDFVSPVEALLSVVPAPREQDRQGHPREIAFETDIPVLWRPVKHLHLQRNGLGPAFAPRSHLRYPWRGDRLHLGQRGGSGM